jgi:uncharacterized protein (DUF885 family)
MKNKILLLFLGLVFSHTTLKAQTLPDLIIQYSADERILERFYTVPGTSESIDRMKTLTSNYESKLEAMNYNRLSLDEKVDYQLFARRLREDRRNLNNLEEVLSESNYLFPFEEGMYAIIREKRRGQQPDAKAMAKRMTDILTILQGVHEKVEEGENIDARLVRATLRHLDDLKEALKEAHEFYYDYDPLYTWWVKKPYEDLDAALGEYMTLLDGKKEVISNQKRDESGIVGVPIGEKEILKRLEYEMIPYTPAELIEIAEQEFAWCDREMLKATKEMGFGTDWKKALEAVKETYVEPGKQPEVIKRLYDESIAFLKDNNLLTIPPLAEETWRMSMMSPERQRINPFFLGGERIQISYPTSTMTHEEKRMSMRGNNPHFSRATVHHELIAGHGLQAFMGQRYKVYRSWAYGDFGTAFWGEGWALYWERLLWDLGFPEGPEDKIGMLFWRMHRCARIIFSLKYHLGEWTPQECIDFLVDRVGHEVANAEGEVRRSFEGGYDPLYQIAYMIGGLQFESLKEELVDGGKMSYREFHDAVLRENRMPVEMVRALMTKQAPPKAFKTSWRFYAIP